MSRSLTGSFMWSATGTAAYNLSQLALVVVMARLGGQRMVGEYALMLALAAPVFVTVGMNLRVVRATDVRRAWSAGQYRRLRWVLNSVAFAITCGIGVALGMRSETLAGLAMVAASKSVEATSLLLYGFFQLRDRLDLVARSLLLRAVTGAAAFVGALTMTSHLVGAVGGLVVGWFAVWALHDRPQEIALLRTDRLALHHDGVSPDAARPTRALAAKAFPLGLDAGVLSLTSSIPRYAVQAWSGATGLGVFAALAYAAQLVSVATGTMGDVVVGRLSKAAALGQRRSFYRMLAILVGFGLGAAAAAIGIALVLGKQLVTLLLGHAYVDIPLLILLLLAAGAMTLLRSLARALQAVHRYRWLLAIDSLSLIAIVGLSVVLVPHWGLRGAATAYALAFVPGIVLTVGLLVRMPVTLPSTSPKVAA